MKKVDFAGLLMMLIGLVLAVGVFFLGSYLLKLTYNATIPKLFTTAQEQENYWTFVLLAIFLSLVGMFLSPSIGVMGGRSTAYRRMQRMMM